jgi:hypothetical protein
MFCTRTLEVCSYAMGAMTRGDGMAAATAILTKIPATCSSYGQVQAEGAARMQLSNDFDP